MQGILLPLALYYSNPDVSKYFVRNSFIKISLLYMTDYFLNVPCQKFPVPKITKQTKSHSLNFNVLSSVIDSSGEEV